VVTVIIDLHCHLLPGIDDGAEDLETSLRMAEAAAEQGITHICCSPHFNEVYGNPAILVKTLVGKLQKEFIKKEIPITLIPAQEVRISKELPTYLERKDILFLDSKEQYFLLEFPSDHIPRYAKKQFIYLLNKGYIPVIVHPERNKKFRKKLQLLDWFIQRGGITQMNAGSLLGDYGGNIQDAAFSMLEKGLIHTIATDAHDLVYRRICLKDAYQKITENFDDTLTEQLQKNAKNVILGEKIIRSELYG
jgi:protein-tyrosine phosphatase